MATNIPPHNLGEVIDATIHLIDNPEATPDDLMQFVKGPDFPTGGSILGRAGIMDAYRTGRGSVKMRATADHRGDQARRHRRSSSPSCRTRRAARRSPAASRSSSTPASSTGIADVNDGSSGGKTEPGHHAQARRQRQRRAQQPLQADPAADQLRRQHGRARRRRAAHAQPRRRRCTGYVAPPGRGHHPPQRVPPRQGPARARTSVEGRLKALNVIDAGHRPHPGQRRPPRPPRPA